VLRGAAVPQDVVQATADRTFSAALLVSSSAIPGMAGSTSTGGLIARGAGPP
jgi:hypothetical protein